MYFSFVIRSACFYSRSNTIVVYLQINKAFKAIKLWFKIKLYGCDQVLDFLITVKFLNIIPIIKIVLHFNSIAFSSEKYI